ncbi:Ldh family oxidoreductase, partial [Rhodobacterales bacterium HKCCE2091]|nr:Ldh family oxidoreductase [Rhodobacterales bacterium HKCCE2091]
MTGAIERLSLAEIEALSRDVLTRAGASGDAARAAAGAVRMAERNGCRDHGLDRVIGLVEGLRMGAIDGNAAPRPVRDQAGRLRVDAGRGLADAALDAGFAELVEAGAGGGAAVLAVSNAGDRAFPQVWAERLADHGLIGIALPDLGAGCLALPRTSGGAGPV